MEVSFLIKKFISLFVMPLNFSVILMLIGIFFLYKKKYKLSKIFLSISFIIICFIGYPQSANLLLKPLESQYATLQNIPKDIKYILLLGGDNKNRAWEVLRLYHNIKDAKIITSGYSPTSKETEAFKTARLLMSVGVKKSDIIIFPNPKDTREEALEIKKYLKQQKFILVTSASHMPRVMKIFNSVGLNPIPSATAYHIKDTDKVYTLLSGQSIKKSEMAIHEYVGLLWEELKSKYK